MALGRTESFELRGIWWRPDGAERVEATAPPTEPRRRMGLEEGLRYFNAPHDRLLGRDAENPCYGTLRFDPSSTLRLELLEASDRVFDNDAGNFVVHGYDANGAPCSLLDCFAGAGPIGPQRGVAVTEIVGHMLVHGEHVATLGEFRFARAHLSLMGLREFLLTPMPTTAGENGAAVDTEQRTARREVSLPGALVSFAATAVAESGHFRRTVETIAWVEIELDSALDHDGWVAEWVVPLTDLMEFATREPARLDRFLAVLPDDDFELPPLIKKGAERVGSTPLHAVSFVEPRTPLRYDEPRHRYERMLLSAGALGDELDAFLARWLEFDRGGGDAAPLLFSTLSSRMYLNQQLVVLGSVAEAYHRGMTKPPLAEELHPELVDRMLAVLDDDVQREVYGPSLRYASYTQDTRIKALIERAGEVVEPLAKKAGRLSNRLVETRNHFVHLPADSSAVLSGSDLIDAVQLLVLVVQVNLLLDMRIEPSHARKLVERSYGREILWHTLVRRGTAWPPNPRRSS